MSQSIDNLGAQAADIAMRAAADYVRVHGLKVVDYQQATDALRAHVKSAVSVALEEAKQAMAANMPNLVHHAFRATMAEAGIAAAKSFKVEAVS